MKIDTIRMVETLRSLVETPSVVGYYPRIHQWLENWAKQHGYQVEYDNRHTAYIRVAGKDSSRTRMLGAHLDTIGMIVRSIDEDGFLNVRNLGGINCHSLEGENVILHTRFDGDYTGMVICKSHSVHVFDDARSLEREPENMAILLDEDVHSKKDVEALGIRPGDLISMEPRFTLSQNGYIKSRHIDNKASAAVLLECLEMLAANGQVPAYDTWFSFPIYEEIGLGGAYVPDEVDEFIALDIGLIGGMQSGDERKVSISGADRIAPYDWDLTSMLVQLAENENVNYAMDVYYRYGSDATAALNGGNNIIPATYGPGCMNSHGYERTHMQSLEETLKLTLAYVLSR